MSKSEYYVQRKSRVLSDISDDVDIFRWNFITNSNGVVIKFDSKIHAQAQIEQEKLCDYFRSSIDYRILTGKELEKIYG